MAKFVFSAFADEAGSSLEEQIKALKENGIHYIEPRNIGGKSVMDLTDDEVKAVKAELDKNGIKVGSLGSPIGKYPITDDFDSYIAKVKRAIEIAKMLDTKNIRMFSFFVSQEELAKHREEVIRRLRVLTDMAKERGVRLCHENESKIYGQNPDEVADVLSNHPRLKGIFDAANFVRDGQDPIKGIDVTLPSLEYIHVKDASYPDRKMWPVGLGQGQYEEVLKKADAAYNGTIFLTLEPHLYVFDAYKSIDHHKLKVGVLYDSPDDAFDGAATHLKNLLTKLGYHEEENKLWKK